MQVRTLPALILPTLPTNSSQRAVTPVPAQDERSQASVIIPAPRTRQLDSEGAELLTQQRQRYAGDNNNGSRTSKALQTYFNIETQSEQERSQALFGVDILA